MAALFSLFLLIPDKPADARPSVSIGILLDGHTTISQAFINNLQDELNRLLGTKYNIEIADRDILSAEWSSANAKLLYRKLVSDTRINIIIGAGVITSTVLAAEPSFAKPVIAIGLLDPKIQGIPPASDNRSNISNFTYVQFNHSIKADINRFYDLVPYKKIAVIANDQFLKMVLSEETIMPIGDTGSTVILLPCPVSNKVEDVLNKMAGVDAAYISYLGNFSEQERRSLIQALTFRKIPTFGSFLKDVHLGALAAIAPEEDWTRLVRRVALNVEAILAGTNASELAVQIDFTESFTINMQTARELGLSPPFSILSQADLLNEFKDDNAPATTLTEAMKQASLVSSEVKIEESSVNIARDDVSLAKAGWRPTLNASGNYTVIDEDTANASYGSQAERTSTAAFTAQQIIYSDAVTGNITATGYLLESARSGLEQVMLDSILTAAKAYLTILKTKTAITIHQQNVLLTNQNLAIARKRETIGYSGLSDVYRWQSKLASAQTDLFTAKNSYRLARIELNRILNRSLQEPLTVSEPSLSGILMDNNTSRKISTLADGPVSFETLARFFINEATQNAPEVQQYDAVLAARERQLLIYERKRYFPVVSLNAQGQHVFSRDGVGADYTGVEPVDDNWNMAMSMTWELYQGGANNSNISQMKHELIKLKEQKHRLVLNIERNVRSNLMDLSNNAVNLGNSRRSSEFAKKNMTLVKDDYESGRVAAVELLDAQNSALTAELTALNSEYDFLISQLSLERSIGNFSLLSSTAENQAFLDRLESFFELSSN